MSKEKDYEAFKELCEITALLNRNAQGNTVTVPADKLAELQRKAGMVDELVYVLEEVNEFLNFAWRDIEMNDYSFTLLEEVICKVQRQIAKAKGEQ